MDGLFMPTHLVVLVLVAVLLFGSKRLPEIGRSLGTGLRGFQEGLSSTPTRVEASKPESTEQ